MGSRKSKFYEGFNNDSYAAIHVGSAGLEVMFGDETLWKAVTKAAEKNMEYPEKIVRAKYHCSINGDFKEQDGGSLKTLRLLSLVSDILEHAYLAGWHLLTHCNLDEWSTYGHTWIMRKMENRVDLESPVSLSPTAPNKLYFSCSKPESTILTKKLVQDMSTNKGIKETFSYAEVNGVKLSLRHSPFEPDLFDWWGGAYLVTKLIEELSLAGLSIILQGSIITKLSPNAKVGVVVATNEGTLKFRRFPKETVDEFKKEIPKVWREGLEATETESMGFSVVFKKNNMRPFDDPKVLLAMFECLHGQGFGYAAGFRANTGGNGTAAMCFAPTDKPPRGKLSAFQLKGSGDVVFCGLEDPTIKSLRKVMSKKWHGGIKDEEPGIRVTMKDKPWNDPIYSQMLICLLIEAMEQDGFDFLAAVATGNGGDIFVFRADG